MKSSVDRTGKNGLPLHAENQKSSHTSIPHLTAAKQVPGREAPKQS